MAAADDVNVQFMGDQKKAKRGWLGLRPKPNPLGKVFSVFLNRDLAPDEGQTLVEAVGTVVHETTLRILPYRGGKQKDVPETTLGHAAAAHGTALDIASLVWDQKEALERIEAKLDALGKK